MSRAEGDKSEECAVKGYVSILESLHRALDHMFLGPKFCPIPNAKKFVFFPI